MQQYYNFTPANEYVNPYYNQNETRNMNRPGPNPGRPPRPRPPMNQNNRFGGGFVLPFALGFLSAPLLTGGIRPYPRPYPYPYQYPQYYYPYY